MDHIINNLWLGNYKDAIPLLKQDNWIVITTSDNCPMVATNLFPMLDAKIDTQDLQNFEEALKFLYLSYQTNKEILVHCYSGWNRSPAIVIAFLIQFGHYNIQAAFKTVKQARPVISPNEKWRTIIGQFFKIETPKFHYNYPHDQWIRDWINKKNICLICERPNTNFRVKCTNCNWEGTKYFKQD